MSKNLCNKIRDVEEPYEVWTAEGGWEWRVLRKYQNPENEAKNQHASWYCAVKSPFVTDWEYGDVYISTIKDNGTRIQ